MEVKRRRARRSCQVCLREAGLCPPTVTPQTPPLPALPLTPPLSAGLTVSLTAQLCLPFAVLQRPLQLCCVLHEISLVSVVSRSAIGRLHSPSRPRPSPPNPAGASDTVRVWGGPWWHGELLSRAPGAPAFSRTSPCLPQPLFSHL